MAHNGTRYPGEFKMYKKRSGILITIAVIFVIVLIVVVLLLKTDTELQIGIASVISPVGVLCAALLGKHKSKKKAAVPQVEQEEEIRDKEKMDAVIQELKERTKTEYYRICLEEEPTNLYSSKLGGIPYWDVSRQYPTGSDGNKLVLLAQINFEKEQFDDERLPRTGILQFFIADDDDFGYDYRLLYDDKQENWSVVYHESVTEGLTEADIMKLNIPTHKTAKCFPMEKDAEPAALKFEKSTGYISTGDYRFEGLLKSILKDKYEEDVTEKPWYDLLSYEEICYIEEALDNWGHRMLGYPNFAQKDIRGEDSLYDTLLLEVDSDKKIMWGDGGMANFFINSENLKKKDFSKVSYSWDCY